MSESTVLLTNKVLHYLRFTRHYSYIATEVGLYRSDILSIDNSNYLIEVEMKNSYQDFLNDFKKTYNFYGKDIKKHEIYSNARSIWVPNYFYFAVSIELKDKVKEFLDNESSSYGLISIDKGVPLPYNKNVYCSVVRKVKLLHDRKVDEKIRSDIINRMSSELISKREKLYLLQEGKDEFSS